MAAWLLLHFWLIPRVVDRISRNLELQGIHFSHTNPKLDLLAGRLSLREVRIHRTAKREAAAIYLSRFDLKIELADLIWNRTVRGEGNINGGRFTIPGKDRDIVFSQLDADLEFDGRHLDIRQFSSHSNFGPHLTLTGSMRWAEPIEVETRAGDHENEVGSAKGFTSPNSAVDLSWLQTIVDVISCKVDGDSPPTLEVKVSLDNTENNRTPLLVKARMQGRDLVWKKLPLASIDTTVQFQGGLVSIQKFEAVGLGGSLTASGEISLDESHLHVDHVRSTMNPIEVVHFLDLPDIDAPSEIEYESPPTLTGSDLLIDLKNLEASQIRLDVDAPSGIRYRAGEGEQEVLVLEKFRASANYSSPPRLEFSEIDTTLNGLDLNGRVTWVLHKSTDGTAPKAAAQRPDKPADPGQQVGSSFVEKINRMLQLESASENRPRLEIDVISNPDLAALGGSAITIVSAKLSGADFTWNGQKIQSMQAELTAEDGLIELEQCHVAGFGGRVETSGSFDLKQKVLKIPELSSTIDLAAAQREFDHGFKSLFDSVVFHAPPVLGVHDLELHFGEDVTGQGAIEFVAEQGLAINEQGETLNAEKFDLAMEWREPHLLSIDRAAGSIGGLDFTATGEVHWEKTDAAPNEAASASETKGGPADPAPSPRKRSILSTLKDYLSVKASGPPVKMENQFTLRMPPAGTNPTTRAWPNHLELTSEISGRNFEWRGDKIVSTNSKFTLEQDAVAFSPLQLETANGTLKSNGVYHIRDKKLRLETLRFGIDPLALLRHFGLPNREAGFRVEFPTTPVFAGEDIVIDLVDWKNSSGTLEKTNDSAITLVTPKKRRLLLDKVGGNFSLRNRKLDASDFSASVFGGDASVDLRFEFPGDATAYSIETSIKRVKLAEFNHWFDPETPATDVGSFELAFRGKGTNLPGSFSGAGEALISADEPMAENLLFLNGLVGALEGLFPSLSDDRDWTFDLPFTVRDSKIHTAESTLTNRRTTAKISGHVDLQANKVELLAKVNLRGLVGIASKLIRPLKSDFLEFRGTGSPGKVDWESEQDSD